LALPTDSSETFLREVDENLRRDQMQTLVKRYAWLIIAAVVLFLAAIGGWLYWQERQQQKVAAQSEELTKVFQDIGTPREPTVAKRLDTLAEEGNDVIRPTALFLRAAIALQNNDRTSAIATYRKIADDGDLPQAYRDSASVRLTTLEFDQIKPEQVIARMEALTKPGEPWYGTAGELTAMALLKQGKKTEAGRLFASIAADKEVPATIRSRAVEIAGTLGVDASASLPPDLAQ
jgi:hypothetical protein